jgi:hypothetical protein
MKVIEREAMPDGTEIQLEDWHEHNTSEYPTLYGYEIGAYPEAQRTSKEHFIRGGERFRLTISQNLYAGYTDEMVLADYEALKSGEKSLEDLAAHFWNGKKDQWLLGMPVENRYY